MDSLSQQMLSLKQSQLRAMASSDNSDSSRKRSRPSGADASKLRMKKAKAKRDDVIKQMGGAASSPLPRASSQSSSRSTGAPGGVSFEMLTKIVDLMRERHKDNLNYPMTLADMQDALNEKFGDIYMPPRLIHWLANEALPNNPKIQVHLDEGSSSGLQSGTAQNRLGAVPKYTYRPPYPIRNRKQLLRLLKNTDLKGEGGILAEDIEESLPRDKAKSFMSWIEEVVVVVQRSDKKQVLFYNDRCPHPNNNNNNSSALAADDSISTESGSLELQVDDQLQKLWNSVQTVGVDESKIEEYLQKHSISSMHGNSSGANSAFKAGRKKNPSSAAAARKKRMWNQKVHNTHMGDVLLDYSHREGPGSAKT